MVCSVACDTGGLKSLPDNGQQNAAEMSGVSAASRLSAAMQSLNPGSSQLAPQSQHHVEQHQEQHQSADGTSSSMAAARSLIVSAHYIYYCSLSAALYASLHT